MSNVGTVTIVLYTDMGPYQEGSRLLVTPAFAQQLVRRYGQGLDIRSRFPGTFWFEDGAVLLVYPRRRPVPPPPPIPVPPQPFPSGLITITFDSTIGPYQEGFTYRLTLFQAQRLAITYPGVTFFNARGQLVSESDLDQYQGRGRLRAELRFF